MAFAMNAVLGRHGVARDLTDAELASDWSLTFDQMVLLKTKPLRSHLGFVVQLKVFQNTGRFPETLGDVSPAGIAYLGDQLERPPGDLDDYAFADRSGRRHRREILSYLGFRRMRKRDREALQAWIQADLCPRSESFGAMVDQVYDWLRDRKLFGPSKGMIERLVRSARRHFDEACLAEIAASLSPEAVMKLEKSLAAPEGTTGFTMMKADAGRVALESVLRVADRLAFIRSLALPRSLLTGMASSWIERFRRRVAQETAWEMRRHACARRLGMYAVFLMAREAEIADSLADLLVETVHKISLKSERAVTQALANDIRRVSGKDSMLANIADAAISDPDGTVRVVIFPIASEQTLAAILKERRAKGSWDEQVHGRMRSSFAGHYRRMLPPLLDVLTFRSNNVAHQPVLEALAWIKRSQHDCRRILCEVHGMPIDDIVPRKWRDLVITKDAKGRRRINRISYELCVLMALRDRLRCKEIWVVGADRYRNPDDDLPKDFNCRRAAYYADLGLDQDAEAFTQNLKNEMAAELRRLDTAMPNNKGVRLRQHGVNRIVVSPFDPLPEPPGLQAVKTEIEQRWPMTGLLDVLKETALDVGFLEAFQTSGARVVLDPDVLHRRLLLCLYGLGTNAGLKRVAAGADDTTYPELLHVRRRFIHVEALRDAIRRVANATLAVRNPTIWGEVGTACASDSKKFGAWDRNLMTEWHARYHGRGVMIYWHVAERATCIYSQLKRCSSSEVASMIEGVLRHCTDLDIQRQYVDSHGQSEVGFAFCRLLSFELAPRLKAISRQKLCLPASGMRGALPNLTPILSSVIDWTLIEQQYDEMVKYASALRHRTADPEAILRRFTRGEIMHPTYKALAELGRAVKTIFLCRYLRSEAFRREIHDGLNIVENWNSANSFVFFGKGGEIATNRLEEQELSALALHLLQSCMVYVNTRMMQAVLTEPGWSAAMTDADYRGMTPNFYSHLNPYGRFDLDLSQRLCVETGPAA
jgi:TnpA family transposase